MLNLHILKEDQCEQSPKPKGKPEAKLPFWGSAEKAHTHTHHVGHAEFHGNACGHSWSEGVATSSLMGPGPTASGFRFESAWQMKKMGENSLPIECIGQKKPPKLRYLPLSSPGTQEIIRTTRLESNLTSCIGTSAVPSCPSKKQLWDEHSKKSMLPRDLRCSNVACTSGHSERASPKGDSGDLDRGWES